LSLEDLSHLPKDVAEAAAQKIIGTINCEPVDVSSDPLFTIRLMRLAGNEYVLALAMDHIISDGTSLGIVVKELFNGYEARARGLRASLPEPQVQLADYATWQNVSDEQWHSRSAEYWKGRLHGAKHLRVFSDSVRIAPPAGKMSVIPIRIEDDLYQSIQDLSRLEKTTATLTLFSAYAAMLMRWCRVTDFVMQFVTSARYEPEIENTVGCFGVPLFLRITSHESDRFIDLLHRITDEYTLAIRHADSGRVAAQVPLPEFGWNPSFNWLPQALGTAVSEPVCGLAVERFESEFTFPDEVVDWDMEPRLSMAQTPQGVTGTIQYRADRCLPATIQKFRRNVLFFAAELTKNPVARLYTMWPIP